MSEPGSGTKRDFLSFHALGAGALRAIFTARERFGDAALSRRTRYAWIGDGNNMAHSWIEAAEIFDLDLAIACPEGYEPDANLMARARASGRGRIEVVRDPQTAATGA